MKGIHGVAPCNDGRSLVTLGMTAEDPGVRCDNPG